MKALDNLYVFKEAYQLLLTLNQHTQKVPRQYKYTLLESIIKDTRELTIIIYRTTIYQDQKIKLINNALEFITRITIQIRILYDLKAISNKLNALLITTTQQIQNHLTAWKNYHKTTLAKQLLKSQK